MICITPSHILLANPQSQKELGNKVQLRTQNEKEDLCSGEKLAGSVFRIFF